MNQSMKTRLFPKVILILMIPALLMATGIRIAPNVLNLGSKGTVVTVHTTLPYSSVMASTVSLNGIEIQSWKADARGNFVAKFSMAAVKSLVSSGALPLGEVTLTLTGFTTDGSDFSGSSMITIIDR